MLGDKVGVIVVSFLQQISNIFLSLLLIIEKMLHFLKGGIDPYEFENRAVVED